jgi:hypothetical protein
MTGEPARVRGLRIALVVTVLFDVLALVLFLHATPRVFTVFMFVGQPLFAVAMILLLGAVLADLRAKQLL